MVMHPNYATNIETPRAIGCQVDYLRLSFEDGFRFDIDALAALIRPGDEADQPDHAAQPDRRHAQRGRPARRGIALAEQHGCYLLVDETYREMNFAGPTTPGRQPQPALHQRGLDVQILRAARHPHRLDHHPRPPSRKLSWLPRSRSSSATRSSMKRLPGTCFRARANSRAYPSAQPRGFETVRNWIEKQSIFEWVEPRGGVVCFPRIKPTLDIDVEAFHRILNETYGTFVGPGHWFGMDRRYMRVGYGWTSLEELSNGLNALSLAAQDARRG